MLVGQIDNLGMGIVPIHFVNFDGFIRESPQSDSEADSDPEAAGPGNWIAFWHGKTQTWPIHDMSYNTHTSSFVVSSTTLKGQLTPELSPQPWPPFFWLLVRRHGVVYQLDFPCAGCGPLLLHRAAELRCWETARAELLL